MGVETEALKSGPGLVKAQDFDNLGACEAACGGGRFGLVIIYHIVEVGAVLGGAEETPGSNRDRSSVLQVGVRHGGRLSSDTVLLSV